MVAPALMAGAIAAPIIGGAIGQQQSQADSKRAAKLQREALARLDALQLPEYDQIGYQDLEDYSGLSQYDPMQEIVQTQDPSQMAGISLDPNMRGAQLQALQSLADIGQNGYTLSDRAALTGIQDDLATRSRGAREAITQNMQQRGISGSGLELAAQLSNQQAAASDASRSGMALAGQAQQRALQALIDRGSMAGNMESQDFARQAQVAQAQDAINRFNTQNRQGVLGSNVDRSNDAQLKNQALMAQQIDKRNANTVFNNVDRVGMNNDTRNMGFQNAYQRAGGQATALNNAANQRMGQAAQTQATWGGVGQGIGGGLATYAAYGDDKKKTTSGKP